MSNRGGGRPLTDPLSFTSGLEPHVFTLPAAAAIYTDFFKFVTSGGTTAVRVTEHGDLWIHSGFTAIWSGPTAPDTSGGHIVGRATPDFAGGAWVHEIASIDGYNFIHNDAAAVGVQVTAIKIPNNKDYSEVSINGITRLTGSVRIGTNTAAGAAAADVGDISAGVLNAAVMYWDASLASFSLAHTDTVQYLAISRSQLDYFGISGSRGRLVVGQNNDVSSLTFYDNVTIKFSVADIGATYLNVVANQALQFGTNNTARWQISATGNLLASVDGTPSIGASGATRPLACYLSGPSITAGSGTGYTLNDSGSVRGLTFKCTVTFAALAAAALTADKTICTLPAKTRLKAVYADTTTKYIGGAVSAATLKLGSSVGGAEILASHDVFTAAVTKGLADADMGTSMTRAAQIQGAYTPSFTGVTTVTVRITTVTANTNALTQGVTVFYFECEVLP